MTPSQDTSAGGTDRGTGGPLQIALANVRYSPNLGDGLLAECLEGELARLLPQAEFVALDLAGRLDYGPGPAWRGFMLTVLMRLPGALRRLATRAMLALTMAKHRKRFAAQLARCDGVVLGGGNLLADTDLNFPIKIAGLLCAAPPALPAHVFAVGVSRNWSGLGTRYFRRAFDHVDLRTVSVRDAFSLAALRAQAPEFAARPVAIVRDPGLLAARHYPRQAPLREGEIGLCITDPLALRYHGSAIDPAALAQWYGAVAANLADQGRPVLLFTNGSPEDRTFLRTHVDAWRQGRGDLITAAEEPGRPADLIATVTRCTLVVAHRMHACIAAHAFAIPTIGLRWDPKLDAFFASTGREDCVIDCEATGPAQVCAMVADQLARGIDPQAHTQLIGAAAQDVATLAAQITARQR